MNYLPSSFSLFCSSMQILAAAVTIMQFWEVMWAWLQLAWVHVMFELWDSGFKQVHIQCNMWTSCDQFLETSFHGIVKENQMSRWLQCDSISTAPITHSVTCFLLQWLHNATMLQGGAKERCNGWRRKRCRPENFSVFSLEPTLSSSWCWHAELGHFLKIVQNRFSFFTSNAQNFEDKKLSLSADQGHLVKKPLAVLASALSSWCWQMELGHALFFWWSAPVHYCHQQGYKNSNTNNKTRTALIWSPHETRKHNNCSFSSYFFQYACWDMMIITIVNKFSSTMLFHFCSIIHCYIYTLLVFLNSRKWNV